MNKEDEKLAKLREAAYKEDASRIEAKPLEVFVPESVEEIRDKVLFSKQIVVRGGGSGLSGVNGENSVIVDLSKMNKILSLDKERKEIYVEAGLVLDELNGFLSKFNLEFPIQPLSKSICTIGGMIACNASGFRELKYGRTGNWVSELELVNGRGELLRLGKADVADVAGQEGITGIITKARLKLIPKKNRTASLFELDNLEQVVDLVKKFKLGGSSMIFFLDKLSSSILGFEDKYHVISEFESLNGEASGKEYDKLLEIIEKVYPSLASLGYTYLEDPKVFIDKFRELAVFLEKKSIPYFGDLGSGVIHPCFDKNQKELIPLMLDNVRKLHGKVTGKFGYGVKKKKYLDNIEKKIIERLKIRYDPSFKINLGVMIDKTIKEEVKMKERISAEEASEEAIEKRAEKNIEETEEELDEELQHKEKIKESDMEDDLAKAVEE